MKDLWSWHEERFHFLFMSTFNCYMRYENGIMMSDCLVYYMPICIFTILYHSEMCCSRHSIITISMFIMTWISMVTFYLIQSTISRNIISDVCESIQPSSASPLLVNIVLGFLSISNSSSLFTTFNIPYELTNPYSNIHDRFIGS